MPNDAYIKDKSIEQLLADLYGTAQPGSPVHEQQKMAIFARSADAIASSVSALASATTQAADQGRVLDRRLFALNVVIVVATIVMATGTVFEIVRALRIF